MNTIDCMFKLETTVHELCDSAEDLALLRHFYDGIYFRQFPHSDERESLVNMENYLRQKRRGWYGKNNYHILLLMRGVEIVGGSVSDYLEVANAGVIEFLVVSPEEENKGMGRSLLEVTEACLLSDARELTGRELEWIAAEMEDPFRVEDGSRLDAFRRARIWGRWGYSKLRFPYVQPALSQKQEPSFHLLLMGKPVSAALKIQVPACRVADLLHEYMRWAMRIDEPEKQEDYIKMLDAIGERLYVEWFPIEAYIGKELDKEKRLDIYEL